MQRLPVVPLLVAMACPLASTQPASAQTIPPRPWPPLGAPATLTIPLRGTDGVRQTVNAGLGPDRTILNLRAAYNVAALNCRRPVHAELVVNYRAFLAAHGAALADSSRAVDADFRRRYGAAAMRQREAWTTEVYNYFANPSTLSGFCDAAMAMSRTGQGLAPGQLGAFSRAELPKLEAVFDSFFTAYERYQAEAAQWDAQYGASGRPR